MNRRRVVIILMLLTIVSATALVTMGVMMMTVGRRTVVIHVPVDEPVDGSVDGSMDGSIETSAREPLRIALPPFTLTRADEQQAGLAELLGSVWVVDFIFTRCKGICPAMTAAMADLADELPAEVKLVSISVDPENDTPAALRTYAQQHRADPARWWFLTGERDTIWRLIGEGFKLVVGENPGDADEPIFHSPRFGLVDRQGQVVGYFNGLNPGERRELIEAVQREVGRAGAGS